MVLTGVSKRLLTNPLVKAIVKVRDNREQVKGLSWPRKDENRRKKYDYTFFC